MKYALINGIVLDGSENMVPQYDKIILVKDGIIENIVNKGYDISGYDVVDLKGQYILPGLVNLHVHLAGSGKPKNNSADARRLVKLIRTNNLTNKIGMNIATTCAETQLMSGTTTIRTVGGIADYDTTIRDEIRAGKRVGPRILAANMAISVPGGHMAGSLAFEAESPEDAAHYVDVLANEGVDIIKLMITGGVSDAEKVGEPGILRMPPEYVKAACDRAHELNYKVAAHIESAEGMLVALRNGVDSIEHGGKPSDEAIKLFKDRDAFFVMTTLPALPFVYLDKKIKGVTPVMKENGKVVIENGTALSKACLENGIPVGLGTDTACPYSTQYDMWRELACYIHFCGVSNEFALYTATKLNAQLAGVGDITGSIEKGKSADMITVEKNPLEDISALRNVTNVIFEGKIIKPKLKKIKVVEEELDELFKWES